LTAKTDREELTAKNLPRKADGEGSTAKKRWTKEMAAKK
jgi:hypothetical protein